MPGWDEASVDELLADPIVRDLMARGWRRSGSIEDAALRGTAYYRVLREKAGWSTSLAGFARLYSGRSNLRNTRIALPDHPRLSMAPFGSVFCG